MLCAYLYIRGAPMIELFGVGIPAERGTWLFRGVTARFETGRLVFIVSSDRKARLGLLDVAAASLIAAEGRAWVSGAPVMRETRKAIAKHAGIVRLNDEPVAPGTVLSGLLPRDPWGLRRMLAGGRGGVERTVALQTLERVGLGPCALEPIATLDEWRRRRLAIARALITRPDHLICREIDDGLSLSQAGDALGVLRTLARSERLPTLISAADPRLVSLFADRVLVLSDGTLTFDGRSPDTASRGARRAEIELLRAG